MIYTGRINRTPCKIRAIISAQITIPKLASGQGFARQTAASCSISTLITVVRCGSANQRTSVNPLSLPPSLPPSLRRSIDETCVHRTGQVSTKSVLYHILGRLDAGQRSACGKTRNKLHLKSIPPAFIGRRVARHFRFSPSFLSPSLSLPLSLTHSLALVLFSSTLPVPFASHQLPETPSNRRVFSTDSGYSDKSSPEISRPLGPGIIPEIRYKFIQEYTVRSPGRVAFGTALAVSRQS